MHVVRDEQSWQNNDNNKICILSTECKCFVVPGYPFRFRSYVFLLFAFCFVRARLKYYYNFFSGFSGYRRNSTKKKQQSHNAVLLYVPYMIVLFSGTIMFIFIPHMQIGDNLIRILCIIMTFVCVCVFVVAVCLFVCYSWMVFFYLFKF